MLVLDQHPGSTYAYLVVRNFGQSVAYHVDVRFDPEICATGTRSKKRSLVPALLRRYENPIPNLMPGVELRNLWFASSGDADDQKAVINDEPIPDVVTATIRYADGPNFWSKDNNRYTDTFVLDVRTLRGDVVVTHSNDQLGLLKRMTSALEMMSTKQTGWGTNISQFLSGATDDRSNWGEENRP